jgi:stage II sporulation protein M
LDEIRRDLQEYFRENMGTYILITALFTGGVLAGALSLRGLGAEQQLLLNRYFGYFIESFNDSGTVEQGAVFRQALILNFQYLFLTWFMGIFLFGFPIIGGLVGLRGFSLGFTVGFLVQRASLRGVLFAAGSVLPHNLILIPALIAGSVTGFSFSWLRLRCYLEKRPCSLREHLGPYSMMFFLVGLLLAAAVLVEAYISPVFLKLLIPVIR